MTFKQWLAEQWALLIEHGLIKPGSQPKQNRGKDDEQNDRGETR
jgi:hypothetical protein